MNVTKKKLSVFHYICAGVAALAYFSYFFKYIGSKVLEMAISFFGGSDSSFGELFDISSYFKAAFYDEYFADGFFDGISDLMQDIFSIGSDEVLSAVFAVVAVFIIPMLLLLVSAIWNLISGIRKKENQKALAIFSISTAVYTFVADIIVKIVVNKINEDSDFSVLYTGWGYYLQLLCVIVLLALSIYLCTKMKQELNTDSGLKPDDVALVGKIGEYGGAVFLINSEEKITIGRDPASCVIVVSNGSPKVSRKHCSVSFNYDRQKYEITDFSMNGTYVNGVKIQSGVPFFADPGSTIELGDASNSFYLN